MSTQSRAYLLGIKTALKPPSPFRAWQLAQQLAKAAPELRSAYELGRSAPITAPLPGPAQLLAQVVQQLAAP